VTVAKPDLRQFDANASGDSLPHHRHLGGEGIAFAPERKIPEVISRRKHLVEMSLQKTEIERQVEPVPTGKRGREEIGHGVSIGELIAIGITIAIAIDSDADSDSDAGYELNSPTE
jgi:hypothetical protein